MYFASYRYITYSHTQLESSALMSITKDSAESPGWRKAQRSMANGNCVEVSGIGGGIAVRDSNDPEGFVLAYPAASWRAFTLDARQGRFDAAH